MHRPLQTCTQCGENPPRHSKHAKFALRTIIHAQCGITKTVVLTIIHAQCGMGHNVVIFERKHRHKQIERQLERKIDKHLQTEKQ